MFAEPFNVSMDGNLVPLFMQIKWRESVSSLGSQLFWENTQTKRSPSSGDQAENPGSCQSGTLPAEFQIMKQNNTTESHLHLAVVGPLLSRFSSTPNLWSRWKSQWDNSSLATGRTWSGLKRCCTTHSTSAPCPPHLKQAPSPFAIVFYW